MAFLPICMIKMKEKILTLTLNPILTPTLDFFKLNLKIEV